MVLVTTRDGLKQELCVESPWAFQLVRGSDLYCIKLVFVSACLSPGQPIHSLPDVLLSWNQRCTWNCPFRIWKLFLMKLSVCKCFQGLVTLRNHGIKIIAFEMEGGPCALHQKFLLVLVNLVYKCHGLHPHGVYTEFLAVSVSHTLQNKCHIIQLWAIFLI